MSRASYTELVSNKVQGFIALSNSTAVSHFPRDDGDAPPKELSQYHLDVVQRT